MGSNVTRFVKAELSEHMSMLSELMRKAHVQIQTIADLVSRSYAQRKTNLEVAPANVTAVTAFSECYNKQEKHFKQSEELKDDVDSLFIGSNLLPSTEALSQMNIQAQQAIAGIQNSNQQLQQRAQMQTPTQV